MSEKLIHSTDSIAAAIAALDSSTAPDGDTVIVCCPQLVRWQPIVKCVDGEPTIVRWVGDDGTISEGSDPPGQKWVDPPRQKVVRGGTSTGRKGVRFKKAPQGGWTAGTWTGLDDDGGRLGEIKDWNGWSDTPGESPPCDVANTVVYSVVDCLQEMDDVYDATVDAIKGLLRLFSAKGLANGGIYIGKAEFLIPTTWLIAAIDTADFIMDILGASFLYGVDDNVKRSLTCAIYSAISAKDLKNKWDSVVNGYFYPVQPQSALLRYLMHPGLAEHIMGGGILRELPRFGYSCSECQTADITINAIAVDITVGSDHYHYYAIEWPTEFTGATSSYGPFTAVREGTTIPAKIFWPTGLNTNALIRTQTPLARLTEAGGNYFIAPQYSAAFPNFTIVGQGSLDDIKVHCLVSYTVVFTIELKGVAL